jgi:hypothetical protein
MAKLQGLLFQTLQLCTHLPDNHISREVSTDFYLKFIINNYCILYFQSVTIHTDVGDIKIELFCEYCPKACEVRYLSLQNMRIIILKQSMLSTD